MISGLRNDWETWTQLERRNRAGHDKAFSQALRICRTDNLNHVELEEIHMAEFATEVEKFLDSTAEALGGDREDLMHFIKRDRVHWREWTYGVVSVRMDNSEVKISYRRPVLEQLSRPIKPVCLTGGREYKPMRLTA